MSRIYMLIVLFSTHLALAAASSSSKLAAASSSSKKITAIITHQAFETVIDQDEQHSDGDSHYPRTVALIDSYQQNPISITASRIDYTTPHISMTKVEASPLCYALIIGNAAAALAIATRAKFRDFSADSVGATPLHHVVRLQSLCACPTCLHNSNLKDQCSALIERFAHQINDQDHNGLSPLFYTLDAELMVKLHAMGAEITPGQLAAIAQCWRDNKEIVAIVREMGFSTKTLARTFGRPVAFIKSAHTEHKTTIKGYMQQEARSQLERTYGTTSVSLALAARERSGIKGKRRNQYLSHLS